MILENYEKDIINKIIDFDNMNHLILKKNKNIIFKGYVQKTIIFCSWLKPITIKIRRYFDKQKKISFYPIYEKYGLVKREKYTKKLKLEVVKRVVVDKLTYTQASVINNKNIPKPLIMKWILEYSHLFKYDIKLEHAPDKYNQIFVNIDDTYKNLKVNNKLVKYRFRVFNFYQDYIVLKNKKKHYVNQIKACLLFKTNQKYDKNISTNFIKNILNKYYNFKKNKQKIIICADGAKSIFQISKDLNADFILDKFHCFKSIYEVFNFRSYDRELTYEKAILFNKIKQNFYNKIKFCIENNMVDKVGEIIDAAVPYFYKTTKIKQLKRLKNYIKKNKNYIDLWKKFSFNPVVTETYIQQIIKSNFGNIGRIFTNKILKNLIAQKCFCVEI